jgi:hypothetical protein
MCLLSEDIDSEALCFSVVGKGCAVAQAVSDFSAQGQGSVPAKFMWDLYWTK